MEFCDLIDIHVANSPPSVSSSYSRSRRCSPSCLLELRPPSQWRWKRFVPSYSFLISSGSERERCPSLPKLIRKLDRHGHGSRLDSRASWRRPKARRQDPPSVWVSATKRVGGPRPTRVRLPRRQPQVIIPPPQPAGLLSNPGSKSRSTCDRGRASWSRRRSANAGG